jgi:hypothetical protein
MCETFSIVEVQMIQDCPICLAMEEGEMRDTYPVASIRCYETHIR